MSIAQVDARKFLTRQEIDEFLLPYCSTYVHKPEDYPRIPELSLKNAIEPKCLQRCVETFERINYAACEAMPQCRDCMVPCLAEATFHRDCKDVCASSSGHSSQSQKRSLTAEGQGRTSSSPAAPLASEECMESCAYYKMFYETKSHFLCPTPYDVSWEGMLITWKDICFILLIL